MQTRTVEIIRYALYPSIFSTLYSLKFLRVKHFAVLPNFERAATSETSNDDVDISDCTCIDYQPVSGVPGFEISTKDDIFWVPIAYRIRTRLITAHDLLC